MAVLKAQSTRNVSYTVMSRQKKTMFHANGRVEIEAGTALYLHEDDGWPCWTRTMPRGTLYTDPEAALADARQHTDGPWYHQADPKHITVIELVNVQHDKATEV